MDAIGPVIAIIRLVVDGMKAAIQGNLLSDERRLKRRLIALQLSLEILIDESDDLVVTLQRFSKRDPTGDDLSTVNAKLKNVGRLTRSLLDQVPNGEAILEEPSADTVVLRVLTPETRRQIIALIDERGGLINQLLWYFQEARLNANKIQFRLVPDMPDFQFDDFSAIDARIDSNAAWRPLSDAITRYSEIVRELKQCSSELSEFTSRYVNLEDVLKYRPEVNRNTEA